MNVPVSRYLVAVPILSSLLVACGGGSDSGNNTSPQTSAPPPVVSQPSVPAAPEPAPAPSPWPVKLLGATITEWNRPTAVINRPTLFEVKGTGLDETFTIRIDGCANVEPAPGNSATRRAFTCTPSGAAGPHTLTLSSSATTETAVYREAVKYLTPVAKVAAINGENGELVVLKEDGSLWTWAFDPVHTKNSFWAFATSQIGTNFTDLETGDKFGLAIDKDGKLWAWGANDDGVYGIGTAAGSAAPVGVGDDFAKVAVKGGTATGGARVVGLKRDGTLWAWGAHSTPTPNSSATQYVPNQFGTGFSDLALGSAGESMAIKPDGSLWQWKANPSNTPFVPTKSGEGYKSVATAKEATFGIRKNGELWTWGSMAPQRDKAGGDNVPVLLGKDFVSVSAGADYAVALKSDGSVWAYGSGAIDRFGSNAGAGKAPVTKNARQVWAQGSCTIIEKVDGTLLGTDHCPLSVYSPLGPEGLHEMLQY